MFLFKKNKELNKNFIYYAEKKQTDRNAVQLGTFIWVGVEFENIDL